MIENSAESLPAGVLPALQNGRPREAEGLLRTFLKNHPDHVDAMTLLGLSLLNQDHAAEAAQCYEKLTRLEP
ncbi:MAG: tetratricopeptide repeat protein, partial [Rudaea sp.]